MKLTEQFEQLFNSTDITLLTDSIELITHAQQHRINARLISELEKMPINSVCITLSRAGTESLLQCAAAGNSGRAIYTQAHAFDPALKSVIYTLEQMCVTDYQLAMRQQEQLLALLDKNEPLMLTGPNTLGYLVIAKDVAPYAMIEEDLQAAHDSFIFPLAELLEVHYAHMDPDAPRPFNLNGRFQVAGILLARGYHDSSIPAQLITSLSALSNLVALHHATAIIEDNLVQSFTVAGRDYCTLLNEATGPRGLRLTECAFGVNASIAATIDYRINSQLNEGIEGMHVAVGDGRRGYHIDLLMPGVAAAPAPEINHLRMP